MIARIRIHVTFCIPKTGNRDLTSDPYLLPTLNFVRGEWRYDPAGACESNGESNL